MITILVDGDACPVKDEIYRVGGRHKLPIKVVSNSWFRVPQDPLIELVVVSDQFDAADDWIAQQSNERAIVITSDIPLADRALKAGAVVLSPKGKPFTEDSIGGALATRAIMADLRAGAVGENIGGPAPFTKKDRSQFLSSLENAITQIKRKLR